MTKKAGLTEGIFLDVMDLPWWLSWEIVKELRREMKKPK